MSSRTRSSWFQNSAQQGVFMKVSTLPSIAKNGPTQIISKSAVIKSPEDKYFKVGKSMVGGEEVVGG